MSEIKINVDLDLETKKAKDQLDNFKKSVKDTKIPVELDISKVKQDAHGLKNIRFVLVYLHLRKLQSGCVSDFQT